MSDNNNDNPTPTAPQPVPLSLDPSNSIKIGCSNCSKLGRDNRIMAFVQLELADVVILCLHCNKPVVSINLLDGTGYRWAVQAFLARVKGAESTIVVPSGPVPPNIRTT